jgi:hypothetical protein
MAVLEEVVGTRWSALPTLMAAPNSPYALTAA